MKINIIQLFVGLGLIVLVASFVPQQQAPTLQEAFKQIKSLQGQVSNLKTSLTNQKEEFNQQITDLESDITRKSLPVGSVIAYNKESYSIPPGWMLCDGGTVTDPSSPLYNTKVPNLVSYFIRGKGKSEALLSRGGKDKISGHNHSIPGHKHEVGSHTHQISLTTQSAELPTFSCSSGYGIACSPGFSGGSTVGNTSHNHYVSGKTENASSGYTAEGGSGNTSYSSDETNIPEYVALNYIVKIK